MEEMTLKDYYFILKRRRWFVVSMTIIFSIVVGIITYTSTEPIYKTYTSLIVEESKNSYDSDNNQKYLDQKFMGTYGEIVKSKLVIDDVRENLEITASFREVFKSIEVGVVPDTDILKIEVTGKDPKLITEIANEIAKVSITHVKEMTDTKNIKVMDKAQVPHTQTNSISKSNIFIAGVLGFLISISVVFLSEYLDNTIKTPKDIKKYLNLPVMGIIQEVDKNLIVYDNPNSFGAENYRTLMTNLRTIQNNKEIRSILITSSKPNEGKSLVAVNLAIAMAKTGQTVLLIDGDLRKPDIHTFLELSNDLGLYNILSENLNYKDVLKKSRLEENLHILTSGKITSNPAELLANKRMSGFLEEVSNIYDFVIINSPSLGALSDATILSTIVDGIMLVCAAGETNVEEVKKGKELLKEVAPNILGVVLNKVDLEKDNYYKYYYNSYRHYNGAY